MPSGTPLWLKVDANGAMVPYYEGSFRGAPSGSTAGVAITARNRFTGQVTVPEYYPNYLTFVGNSYAHGVKSDRPVAGMWAEYPDPIEPPGGDLLTEKLRVQVFKAPPANPDPFAPPPGPGTIQQRTLLDANGLSDFAFNNLVNHKVGAPGWNSWEISNVVTWGANGTPSIAVNLPNSWRYILGVFFASGYAGYVVLNTFSLYFAGTLVSPTYYAYTNTVNSHAAYGGSFARDWGSTIGPGTWSMQISYGQYLTFDANDYFSGLLVTLR